MENSKQSSFSLFDNVLGLFLSRDPAVNDGTNLFTQNASDAAVFSEDYVSSCWLNVLVNEGYVSKVCVL